MSPNVIDSSPTQFQQSNRPGLRRVLDALGLLASELDADKHRLGTPLDDDWRSSFVAGQTNVIRHYRTVLATQRMPPAERQALLDRIAVIEAEIKSVQLPAQGVESKNAA